jgi:pseudouridine synthase
MGELTDKTGPTDVLPSRFNMLIRLNKFLAQSGVASRREADRLIAEGRVRVNYAVIEELGTKIDPARDSVRVDGRIIKVSEGKLYILLNKPPGYLVTLKDPFKRPTILELLPTLNTRVFPVGRLDFNSEGLLLLTNDGELANRLMHPRYRIKKVYEVRARGIPSQKDLQRLEKGILLDGKRTAPAKVTPVRLGSKDARIRIELTEGRKREVRRMFEAVGHGLFSLERTSYAGLTRGNLKKGRWRNLTPSEVAGLKKQVGLD